MRGNAIVSRMGRCTVKGYLGLLVGGAAAASFAIGWSGAGRTATATPRQAPPPPTERIDVEQAVDFPYDI